MKTRGSTSGPMTIVVFYLRKWFKWQEMTSLSAAYQLHPWNSSVFSCLTASQSVPSTPPFSRRWHKGVFFTTCFGVQTLHFRCFIGPSCCTHHPGSHSCGDRRPRTPPVPASAHTPRPGSPVSCCWVNRGWWTCVKLWSTARDSPPRARTVPMNVGKSPAAACHRERTNQLLFIISELSKVIL